MVGTSFPAPRSSRPRADQPRVVSELRADLIRKGVAPYAQVNRTQGSPVMVNRGRRIGVEPFNEVSESPIEPLVEQLHRNGTWFLAKGVGSAASSSSNSATPASASPSAQPPSSRQPSSPNIPPQPSAWTATPSPASPAATSPSATPSPPAPADKRRPSTRNPTHRPPQPRRRPRHVDDRDPRPRPGRNRPVTAAYSRYRGPNAFDRWGSSTRRTSI